MAKVLFEKLAVIGVGLIGGSFSLALKKAGVVGEVIGVGRSRPNLEKALELGVVDYISRDPAEGVKDADLVFLATPVLSLTEVAATAAAHMKRGAILTDGGSVKGTVAGVDSTGALVLADGPRRARFLSGEISLRRA